MAFRLILSARLPCVSCLAPAPPSLVNIYKELEEDIDGFKRPDHGYLMSWAQQGQQQQQQLAGATALHLTLGACVFPPLWYSWSLLPCGCRCAAAQRRAHSAKVKRCLARKAGGPTEETSRRVVGRERGTHTHTHTHSLSLSLSPFCERAGRRLQTLSSTGLTRT